MSKNAPQDALHLEIEELKRRVSELENQNSEFRDQKKRVESLYYDSPYAIAALNETDDVVSCNRRFEDLFLYKESEICGKRLDECIGKPNDDSGIDRAVNVNSTSNREDATAIRQYRKDGTPIDVERQHIPIVAGGKCSGGYVLFRENELDTIGILEQVLPAIEHIFRAAPLSVGLHQDRVIKWISDKEPGILGYVREEIIGHSTRFLYASDAEFKRVGQEQYLSIRERGFASMDVRLKKKDGSIIDAHTIVLPFDPEDPEKGLVFMTQDITKRKRSEEALRESEEKYRLLFDNAEVMVSVYDRDGVCLLMNRKVAALLGGEPSDFIGKSFLELHPEQDDSFIRDIKKIIDSGVAQYHQGEVVFPEGARWLSSRVHPVRDAKGFDYAVQIISEDVTERIRTEQALRESEQKYRHLIEQSSQGITITQGIESTITFANPQIEEIFGYTPEELLQFTPEETRKLIHPEDRDLVFDRYLKRLKGASLPNNYEIRGVRKDGTVSRLEIHSESIEFRDEPAVLTAFTDVTERKQAEEALKESEEKYRELVENANSIILKMDLEGRITFYNEYARSFFGYPEDEVIGKSILGVLTPVKESTGRDLETFIRNLIANPERYRNHKNENLRRNGERVWVSWTNKVILDKRGDKTGILSIGNDITEMKRLEDRLLQSQKMEAIGTLAGGIAHDFNNILSAIIGYAELTSLDIQEGTQTKRNVNEMIKAAMRARELVNQILAFSRKDEQTLKPVDLRPVVEEILGMLRASLPSTIEIRKQIDSDVKNVNADTTQIHQVLLNLCTNASHAMEEHGGKLEVRLTNAFVDERVASQYPDAAPGPYVRLTVGDTGRGMPPDIIARIFDPYFTTKEKGMGTGMGLA